MKETHLLMGMPVTVEIVDHRADAAAMARVYDYFRYVDETFSTYRPSSEISRINRGRLREAEYSDDMRVVLRLCRETSEQTRGYFDIGPKGRWDPSGVVKGWAVKNAAGLVREMGFEDFWVEAGGDVQAHGSGPSGGRWRVGIRNPFDLGQIVKVIGIESEGVATSGTYVRGQHIRNPYAPAVPLREVVSLTVVGPDIYEADRFATAAFAMGVEGINFIESVPGLEGYQIDRDALATLTTGFHRLVLP